MTLVVNIIKNLYNNCMYFVMHITLLCAFLLYIIDDADQPNHDNDEKNGESNTGNISGDCTSSNISVCENDEAHSENLTNDSETGNIEHGNQSLIDPNNLKFEYAVGKRYDCRNLIYTTQEKQYYGKNKKENSEGETAYLCRLYSKLKCRSRVYLKNDKLYRKIGFIPHNHGCQNAERIDFQAEFEAKVECSNLDSLVNAASQTSAVSAIFDRVMQRSVTFFSVLH